MLTDKGLEIAIRDMEYLAKDERVRQIISNSLYEINNDPFRVEPINTLLALEIARNICKYLKDKDIDFKVPSIPVHDGEPIGVKCIIDSGITYDRLNDLYRTQRFDVVVKECLDKLISHFKDMVISQDKELILFNVVVSSVYRSPNTPLIASVMMEVRFTYIDKN